MYVVLINFLFLKLRQPPFLVVLSILFKNSLYFISNAISYNLRELAIVSKNKKMNFLNLVWCIAKLFLQKYLLSVRLTNNLIQFFRLKLLFFNIKKRHLFS